MGKLFLVGDSITAGAWDANGGWAGRVIGQVINLTTEAFKNSNPFYCLPYNLGVSGDTVPRAISRLRSEISARLDNETLNERIQIVFALGVNDSVFLTQGLKNKFSHNEFEGNLSLLFQRAREITDNISFIGLLPVDDDLVNPCPWAPDVAYGCEWIKGFEDVISNFCAKQSLPFLPLFDSWFSMPDYKSLLMDGVHPNSEGHQIMSEHVGRFLINDAFIKFHSSIAG